jgi:sugar phosphate isomerase/epimerase
MRWPILLSTVALCVAVDGADQGTGAPKLFAYCIEMAAPGRSPRPMEEQARLLRDLGYTGLGCELAQAETALRTLDDAGLALDMVWTTINVNPAQGPAYGPEVPAAIGKLKGRPSVVCVLLTGFPPGDMQGMEPAVKALREIGGTAAQAGVRISIYNHADNWTESVAFCAEVVRRTDHPQVGFNFNVCHWLKVSGRDDYERLLRDNVAKLFCVTINGATVGAKTWTNGLIRPLDEGDFDLSRFLSALDGIGYRGPVGLMCYGVPGDAREHLARSMSTWRHLHEK